MADVIATEVGLKKVRVQLVDSRYVLTNPGTYRLRLNAPVNPFPSVSAPWAITGISPPTAYTDTNPDFTLTGSGFFNLLPLIPAAGAYAVDGILVNPTPLAFDIPADDTMIVHGVVPATVALAGPMLTPVIRISAPGYPDVDSPPWDPLTPVVNPINDGYYEAYTGSPGQFPITVGGVNITAHTPPAMYEQTVAPPLPVTPVQSWSYAVWFRRQDYDGGLLFFANHNDASWNLNFYNGALESVQVQFSGGPFPESLAGALPMNDYGWHLAVIVRDFASNYVTLYLDGSPVDQKVLNPVHDIWGGSWVSGKTDLPPLPSTQAAGAVWYRALSTPEVATLWATTVFPP